MSHIAGLTLHVRASICPRGTLEGKATAKWISYVVCGFCCTTSWPQERGAFGAVYRTLDDMLQLQAISLPHPVSDEAGIAFDSYHVMGFDRNRNQDRLTYRFRCTLSNVAIRVTCGRVLKLAESKL